ncbi:MAG: EAL domain-containing protein [Desulfitobacteriaceae bacterium]
MFAKFFRKQKKLHQLLCEGHPVWVLYLDLVQFHEVEFRYGNEVCRRILETLEQELEVTLKDHRKFFLFTILESRGGDDFVVYLVPYAKTPWHITELTKKWVQPLELRLNSKIRSWVKEKISMRAGVTECIKENGGTADYLLYAAVKEAFLLNKSDPDPNYFARRLEIARLLKEPDDCLKAAFQPILKVRTGEILGFEALSRISGTTSFSNIAELFPFAEKIGQLYPIETLCRRKAISSSSQILHPQELLFLNINPQVLTDPDFASGQTRTLLQEQKLNPSDVVLEITERSAIEDFKVFREALAHYRNQGYLIALDDVGAGYSSLQSIAELHPDFLKVDRSLITNVNQDPTKWALLETFVTFSKRIGCQVIAEGVETGEEMRTVVQLGVDYIQGYHIGRPDFERGQINPAALETLKFQRRVISNEENTILSLIEPLPLFNPNTLVSTVQTYFENQLSQWLIGVVENDRLVGVVERARLYAALSTRYGIPLYSNRTISLIMDKNPLIIEDSTPIEVVSTLAMERPDAQLYEGIVVVNQQKPVGMVSVASMMKAIAERQIQIARGVNPLTGLPGNIQIDREIKRRLDEKPAFGIIYADLNKFKHYNDLYGFEQGDSAIKMLAEILRQEALKQDEDSFVGHIGGDDFIIILGKEHVENCCNEILDSFRQERQNLLGVVNLTVALAGLIIEEESFTPITLAAKAAQVKREVKQIGGNSFLIR